MTEAPRPAPFHKRHRRTISVGLSVVGLALLGLAIYFSLGTARGLAQASDAISRLTWWHIAIALGVPLVNFFLTSLIFWLLTARGLRGITPVPRGITYGEMLALITSGTLLNQLPGKPGIVGRTLYHKFITGIPIRYTLLVMIQAIACGGAGVVLCMAAGVAWAWQGPAAGAAVLALIIAGSLAGAIGIARSGLASATLLHVGLVAMGVRAAETMLWSLRYWVMLGVAGRPISIAEAGIIAAASQMAILLPIQIGLREWTVGLVAGLLAAISSGGSAALGNWEPVGEAARPGVLADLLCRGADLAVMIPAGLLASWIVYRSVAKAQSGATTSPVTTVD